MDPKQANSEATDPRNEESASCREPGTTSCTVSTKPATEVSNVDDGAVGDPDRSMQESQTASATQEMEVDGGQIHEKSEDRKTNVERKAKEPPSAHSEASRDTPGTTEVSSVQSNNAEVANERTDKLGSESKASLPASVAAAAPEPAAPTVSTPPASKMSRKVSFGDIVVTGAADEKSKPDTSTTANIKSNPTDAPSSHQTAPPLQAAQAPTPSTDDAIDQLRAPLISTYSPFIHPSDTSLEDARHRLRTSLEQTRQLRSIFSQRVYEKYHILLRPVPKSIDSIVNPISADPLAAGRKLATEIRRLKQEKAAEKKEAQKLAAAKPMVGPDGAPLPNAALGNGETMDQLAYIGAGLSFVVLPEEDIDESQVTVKGFGTRGPIDPETGQRAAGISAAAASAAEVIIDRARRSTALRTERRRRREQKIMSGEPPEEEMDSAALLASLQLLTGSSTRMEQARPAAAKSIKAIKRGATKAKASLKPPSGAGKYNRARTGVSMSGSSLLSFNPNAEEITAGGKPSAATYALKALGVGATSARSFQQRWRHPHPESAGGRRSLLPTGMPNVRANDSTSLPAAPFGKRLRDAPKVPVLDRSKAFREPPGEALCMILGQFIPSEPTKAPTSNFDVGIGSERREQEPSPSEFLEDQAGSTGLSESQSSDGDSAPSVKRTALSAQISKVRRASEIRLLHHLRQQSARSGSSTESAPRGTRTGATTSNDANDTGCSGEHESSFGIERKAVDPVLAFSVLKGLGVVRQGIPEIGADKIVQERRALQIDADLFEKCPQSSGIAARIIGVLGKIQTDRRCFSRILMDRRTCDVKGQGAIGTDGDDPKNPSAQLLQPDAKRLKSNEAETLLSEGRDPIDRDEGPVVAIRGGGEVLVEGSDKDVVVGNAGTTSGGSSNKGMELTHSVSNSGERANPIEPESSGSPNEASSPARESSAPPFPMETSLPHQSDRGHLRPYSPPRSGRGHPRTGSSIHRSGRERMNNQSHSSIVDRHASSAPSRNLHAQGRHPAGDLTPIGGLQGTNRAAETDWSSIGAAGVLDSPQSLSAMNLAPQRAALLGLSVRDGAGRAFLLREQQNAAAHALAAHQQVSAVAAVLSPQEAAVLLGSQPVAPGAAQYSQPPAGHLSRSVNDHAAPPIIGPPRSVAAPSGPAAPSQYVAKNKKSEAVAQYIDKPTSSPSREQKEILTVQEDTENFSQSETRSRNDQALGKSSPAKPPGSSSRICHNKDERTPDLGSAADQSPNDCVEEGQGIQDTAPEGESKGRSEGEPSITPPDEETVEGGITASSLNAGMQFFLPATPPSISPTVAELILKSRFHDGLRTFTGRASALVEYLSAVAAAVPIPKALVNNPLRECLNTLAVRNQGGSGTPGIPRDVICFTILVWLWVQHKESFQRAFAKSGRIDVDPRCKWLIQTAVNTSVRAIAADRADAVARGGLGAVAQGESRTKPVTKPTSPEEERGNKMSLSDSQTASLVSQALMKDYYLDDETDMTLAAYEDLVNILDECRLCALRSKSRERILLSNLLSRRATVSEHFSQAYVGAMARAGEGLGHKELFKLAKDADATIPSTLLPYDCVVDDAAAGWEDAGRPVGGFTPNLRGEDLVRQANARALIQKSLKKMQDRNHIRGGTSIAGPYSDPSPSVSERSPSPTGGSGKSSAIRGLRRKSSFASSDASLSAGTGSAVATSLSLYNPNHYSSPLFWDGDELENTPYGMFTRGLRRRSLSLGRMSFDEDDIREQSSKKRRLSRSASLGVPWPSSEDEIKVNRDGPPQGTDEIPWEDVAMIFQPVALPEPSSTAAKKQKEDHHAVAVPAGTTIFAPFCRRIDDVPASSGDEEASEEDLSDESVLARHKVVLDGMKEKLDKVMAARPPSGSLRGRGRPPAGR